MEVKDQRQMLVSFLYHLAMQRNIRNPFEVKAFLSCMAVCFELCSSAGQRCIGNAVSTS